MSVRRRQRDPIAAYQRRAIAERRVGNEQMCACGESRPEALIAGSKPIRCAACMRKKQGKSVLDAHHVAGKSNCAVTIPVPVNDHRADLSAAQHDWPQETLENPDGSPLLAAAACIRGFADTIFYLVEKLLLWIPEFLEALDAFLVQTRGQTWWADTSLEQFAPKRNSTVKN